VKEQFFKIFHGEPDLGTTPQGGGGEKQGAKVAGSGQFTLFGDPPREAAATLMEPSGRKNLATVPHFYQWVAPGLALDAFLKTLMQQNPVCFDTETSSLNPLEAELVGIAF